MQVAISSTSKANRAVRGGRAVCRAAPEAAQAVVSRRTAAATLAAAVVALSGQPAQALFGFGDGAKKEYEDRTSKLLADIRTTVAITGDDDEKEAAVKTLKKEMNDWTAKYRNSGEGGRPSFSNMYSAVNALAGHWTSFGADAPVPKKRMARISKELDDVERYLARGR